MNIKIKITIPQTGPRYGIQADHGVGHRNSPVLAYRYAERRLEKFFKSGGHMAYVLVDYGEFLNNQGKMANFHNDGDYFDFRSAMYALTCFLEDQLPLAYKKDKEKKYWPVGTPFPEDFKTEV